MANYDNFKQFALQQKPNMTAAEMKQLDDWIAQKKASELVASGGISLEDLPADNRMGIISNLPADYQPKSTTVTPGDLGSAPERESARNAVNFLRQVEAAQKTLEPQPGEYISTGIGTNILDRLKGLVGIATPQQKLRNQLTDVTQVLRKARTGVAFGEEEAKEYSRTVGTLSTQEKVMAQALEELRRRSLDTLRDYNVSPDVLSQEGLQTTGGTRELLQGIDAEDEALIQKYRR